jgi:hypothetical protein
MCQFVSVCFGLFRKCVSLNFCKSLMLNVCFSVSVQNPCGCGHAGMRMPWGAINFCAPDWPGALTGRAERRDALTLSGENIRTSRRSALPTKT